MLRVPLFLLLCAASAAAFLFLLPWLKEGIGPEDLSRFLGVTCGLAVLAAAWWAACRKAGRLASAAFLGAGLLIVALPLFIYGWASGSLILNQITGLRLERSARIEHFRETPILWPGFTGPVGIRIEMDLVHAAGKEGNLFPPKILMGKSLELSYRSYESEVFWESKRRSLRAPLFRSPAPSPAQMAETTRKERQVMTEPSPAHLTYELYPESVWRLAGPAQVCSMNLNMPNQQADADGEDLSASWFFAASGGLRVDLSGLLTDTLRKNSAFQGKPGEWKAMLERLEPASLEKAGYRVCQDPAAGGSGEMCWCRATAVSLP